MEVMVNDQAIPGVGDVTTVGMLMDNIQENMPQGHIVSDLLVDGESRFTYDAEALMKSNIETSEMVHIVTSPLARELLKALDSLIEAVDSISVMVRESIAPISRGEWGVISDDLAMCFSTVEIALQHMEQVYGALPSVGLDITETEKTLFGSLENVGLSKATEALANQEWNVVVTIFEQGFLPTMATWKNTFNQTILRLKGLPLA